MHYLISGLTAAAAAALCALPAQAFYVNASGAYNGKADIDGGGEASTAVYRLTVGGQYLTFFYKHTSWDFSGRDDPFDSLNYTGVDAHLDGSFSTNWGYFAGLTLAMGFEEDIHLEDNYAVTPRLGLSYQFLPGTRVFLGAAAQFNEVENQYLPIIGIEFGSQRDQGLTGSIAYPATRVTYRFNATWAVEGVFLTVRELCQLADDSSLLPQGYIFEESYGASAGVIVTPLEQLEIRAGLQSYFDREYTLYNKGGHEVASFDMDPSTGLYGSVNFKF